MELAFNASTVRKTELEKSRDARDNFLKISYLPNFVMPDNYKSKYFIYIIKNCARRPCMHKGYYIIYLNNTDRDEILQKAIKREETQIAKCNNYYNTYGEAPLSKLPAYIEMVQWVERFMDNPSEEFFTNEGYDAHVLTHGTDPSRGRTYRLDDINTFFNS